MAIGRITGQMLSANLARSGTDLTFETNLLALDVTNSRIGIGTASPATTLHISATDALRLPAGNTAQRPGSPANGDIRYNSTTSQIEGYAGSTWAVMTGGTQLFDADGDTVVSVERTADEDVIHFATAGSDRMHIRADGTIEMANLSLSGQTISGIATNTDITLTPNGTGKVIITNGITLQTNTADINGGAIDGTTIGGASAAAGTFTTATATNVQATNFKANDGTAAMTIADATGDVNVSTNFSVDGNLTVNGTTTTIDSQTLTIEDPLLQLAKNNSGGIANTFDQGLFFNRGSLDNVSFLWDESADQFAFAVTSAEDGTTAGNVTIDSYASLRANVITGTDVETGTISAADGTQSATIANSTGVMTIASSVLTTSDINGGTADNVTIGGATPAAGTFTTATATNVQTSTVKANDGTAAVTIADSTGAVGISTNVSVDGGTFIFNEAGADKDFRFEGDNNANLLFGDAGNDRIGIHTATPSYVFDMASSTDAFTMPQGDTASRPSAATGIMRFNTQTGIYEGSTDGSTWVSFATAGNAPTFTKETTTGDGSTTTFTGFFSTEPESANNVFVYIDNVYQEPTENYSVSGTNITFTSAPHSGARIFAITGADNTALVTGGVARSETTAVSVSGSSATTVFSFNAATYRSAEIFIQVSDSGNTEYSAMKGIVIHDGTTAYISVFGITNTGANDLSVFTATHDGSSTVNVQATPNNSGTQSIKVQYSLA